MKDRCIQCLRIKNIKEMTEEEYGYRCHKCIEQNKEYQKLMEESEKESK